MRTIYTQALKGELGESLSLEEFAQLRAFSFDGLDEAMYGKLCTRMKAQAAVGLFAIESHSVTTQRPTGRYLVERQTDCRRDGFSAPPTVIEEVTCNGAEPPLGARPVMESQTHLIQRVTRTEARKLFSADPKDWSNGAKHWAGIEAAAQALPNVGADETKEHLSETQLGFPIKRALLGQRLGNTFNKPGGGTTSLETLLDRADVKEACQAKMGGGWYEMALKKWLKHHGYTQVGYAESGDSNITALTNWSSVRHQSK